MLACNPLQGPKITLKYPGGLVHENETAFTRVGLIETNEPIDSCVCTQVTGTLAFECHMDPLTNGKLRNCLVHCI